MWKCCNAFANGFRAKSPPTFNEQSSLLKEPSIFIGVSSSSSWRCECVISGWLDPIPRAQWEMCVKFWKNAARILLHNFSVKLLRALKIWMQFRTIAWQIRGILVWHEHCFENFFSLGHCGISEFCGLASTRRELKQITKEAEEERRMFLVGLGSRPFFIRKTPLEKKKKELPPSLCSASPSLQTITITIKSFLGICGCGEKRLMTPRALACKYLNLPSSISRKSPPDMIFFKKDSPWTTSPSGTRRPPRPPAAVAAGQQPSQRSRKKIFKFKCEFIIFLQESIVRFFPSPGRPSSGIESSSWRPSRLGSDAVQILPILLPRCRCRQSWRRRRGPSWNEME